MTIRALMAEFAEADTLLAAAKAARKEGYTRVEGYSPFSVDGLAEALDHPPSRVRWVMFTGGLIGALIGYGIQHWTAVYDYPINSGGRALGSWPAFLFVTFELAVLGAAAGGLIAVLVSCGLPRLHHPNFYVKGFDRVNQDRFFLEVSADDPLFDLERTREFFDRFEALSIQEVTE